MMSGVITIMQATFGDAVRSKRPPMPGTYATFTIALCALVAGCTASGEEVQPDDNQLFFPTAAVVSPDGARLFVVNANSDLTYDSGTINVVPLATVEGVIAEWTANRAAPSGCFQDTDFTETLVCDESLFLNETGPSGVRIGNFATDLALQDFTDGRFRLIAPTRGDPSITWVDWDPGAARLSCNENGRSFELCDDAHRLSFLLNDSELASIFGEPFAAYGDTAGQFVMVTHLDTAAVTLIDSPRDGAARITDIALEVFLPDPPMSSNRGATSVLGRTPRADNNLVYVGSRTDDRIQTFSVGRPINGAPPFLIAGDSFALDAVGGGGMTTDSRDTRGMAFSPSGDRLFLVNRRSPSLQIYDTSVGPAGMPQNLAVGATDLCRQASTIALAGTGDNERVYVTCFQDGQIYAIDPRGHGHVEDIIVVGRGPNSVVAAPDGKRLYVTNFLEDTVAVIDIEPGSKMRNRVVLRIGEPRVLESL